MDPILHFTLFHSVCIAQNKHQIVVTSNCSAVALVLLTCATFTQLDTPVKKHRALS